MTDEHKSSRLEWAKQQLQQAPPKLMRIAFSEEKWFCLDGLDGAAYYWTDKRIDPRQFSTRGNCGGSIMVWGYFSAAGAPNLVTVEGTLDSSGYCNMLKKVLLPFAEGKHLNGWCFQQGNASVHRSDYTRKFFSDMEIAVMECLSRIPDLHPIENLWGFLVRKVYK